MAYTKGVRPNYCLYPWSNRFVACTVIHRKPIARSFSWFARLWVPLVSSILSLWTKSPASDRRSRQHFKSCSTRPCRRCAAKSFAWKDNREWSHRRLTAKNRTTTTTSCHRRRFLGTLHPTQARITARLICCLIWIFKTRDIEMILSR